MVFQKRYGFKFLPLDGENTTFSYTRGVALGGSILLAFLFAGLGVPVVEYVIIFGVTVFLVSLIGEKWSRLGFALTISLAIGFLSLLVHFQFAGIGRHQGIGLLYGYAGAVFALSISDYLRSKQSTQNRAAFLCLCAAFALLLFLGFFPLDKSVATTRALQSCSEKAGFHWRGELYLGYSSWLGKSEVSFTKAMTNNKYHNRPRATYHGLGADRFSYGKVNAYLFERHGEQTLLGLDLLKKGRRYTQWIGPISKECRTHLRDYTAF